VHALGFTHKYEAKGKSLSGDKHSSLFVRWVGDEEKSFKTLTSDGTSIFSTFFVEKEYSLFENNFRSHHNIDRQCQMNDKHAV
jgi:hypothetical protein